MGAQSPPPARIAIADGLRPCSLLCTLLCTLLYAALVMVSPARAGATDAAFDVTYLEVPVTAAAQARSILQRYAATERAAALNAGAVTFQIDVLQEIDRPERWLLLEWADSPSRLLAIEAAGAEDLARLQTILVAPSDRRSNHPLAAAASGPERQSSSRNEVYAVSHLDIGKPDQSGDAATPAVERLVDAARGAPGNLRAEAWQQNGRTNHYALLFVWRNRAARDAFADGPAVHRFRTSVGPLLGSPYDERIYRLAN